jgi:preprotein translocase SecF subunit
VQFFKTPNIDFVGKRYISFTVSIILLVLGIFGLAVKGPNYGIDFSGGILMQFSFNKDVQLDTVRQGLASQKNLNFELQSTGNQGIIVRVKKTDKSQDEMASEISSVLKSKLADTQITVDRVEYVGPAVGKHLSKQAMYAFSFVFIGIIIYVAFRFKSAFWGIVGVLALIHDVFVTFGIMVLTDRQIDLTLIAALLTIVGYSINNTIVLFDRIRENLRLIAKQSFASVINVSINQVLGRSVLTSLTVAIVSLIILFLGGEVISDFGLALFLGNLIGFFSSVFICAPLTYEWEKRKKERFKKNNSSRN